MEEQISDKREWVINIRSASNVLLGEGFLYAFPVALPDKNIVRKGEVIASLNIRNIKLTRDFLRKQIKILLASTLAEVKTRGSFATEIKVDSNSIQKLFDQLEFKKESILKLDAISTSTSDTADKVSVRLRVTKQPI